MKDSNMGCLNYTLAILLAFAIVFIVSLIPVGALYLIYSLIIVPTFGAPTLSFWAVFWIVVAIDIVASLFRGVSSSTKN